MFGILFIKLTLYCAKLYTIFHEKSMKKRRNSPSFVQIRQFPPKNRKNFTRIPTRAACFRSRRSLLPSVHRHARGHFYRVVSRPSCACFFRTSVLYSHVFLPHCCRIFYTPRLVSLALPHCLRFCTRRVSPGARDGEPSAFPAKKCIRTKTDALRFLIFVLRRILTARL